MARCFWITNALPSLSTAPGAGSGVPSKSRLRTYSRRLGSFDAAAIRDGLGRWAAAAGLGQLPIESAIVFPRAYSRLILEEPADEIVTPDNTPWWAHRIGRTQRLDAARSARVVEAVLAAADAPSESPSALRRVAR